ncbi:uncharacterized protein EI90DRAFT_3289840 [Cantharellus anzutake]|uniref:uncharacterized protein n=1 Tax=Cantharellus anzutake TaxID=1750568 RepID=UPI00190498A4|nr:uncharacterized protein EI90DRAFT_3289840 [Cantharellus anzutake]KAF8330402.1 hypothetical protein EI90DRAFT_3289840 [Cantharellus anzutake]
MRFWNFFTPIAFLPISTADFTIGTISIGTYYSQGAAVNSTDGCATAVLTGVNGHFQVGEHMRFNVCESDVEISNTAWNLVFPEETLLGVNGTCSEIQGSGQWCIVARGNWTWNPQYLCQSIVCEVGTLD